MTEFLDVCYNAIKKQATAIPNTLEVVERDMLDALKKKRLVFTGCGDSYAVGEYGKWAFLAASRDSLVLSPPELPMVPLDEKSVVIGITASGRSLETVSAMKHARKKGAETIVLTDDAKGAAYDYADHIWLTKSGVETYNTSPSAPTTAAMAFLLKLAALERDNPHTYIGNDVHQLEYAADLMVVWAESVGKDIAKIPNVGDLLYMVSDGPNYVAAQLGMMKFNEYSLVKGTSALREEFRHHYNISIKHGDPMVLISNSPAGEKDELYISILSDILKMRPFHLFCPLDLELESPHGQAIANTIALQMAAFHFTLRNNPKMDKFKLPHAEAFKIY
ncbi:MAG: SIS domain-containing protein [Candidatus Thorarchaeota archaeon]